MSTQQTGEIDLIALLGTLWQHKYIVVVATALFVVGSLYIAITATPLYRADVVVARVSNGNMSGAANLASQFGGLGRLAGINLNSGGPGQEAQAVLESRRLTEEFIKSKDLLDVVLPDEGRPKTLWRAVVQFRDAALNIREDVAEGISTVSISWTDPETAALWANEYVALANELLRTRALTQAESNIEYLRKQVEDTNVVELERVIYDIIESEIQTLMLANGRAEYAFTVVDPAVAPEIRVSPRRKVIVLSGTALGVVVGIVLVLFMQLFSRVRQQVAS